MPTIQMFWLSFESEHMFYGKRHRYFKIQSQQPKVENIGATKPHSSSDSNLYPENPERRALLSHFGTAENMFSP